MGQMQHINLLLVEDDERLARFTGDYLHERGLTVTSVRTGEAAMSAVRRQGFDIVVLDVMLPGKDGVATCRAIREYSDLPILLVTARGEEADRVLGLEAGADDYVVKPFLPRELLARVQAFVRRYRGDLAVRTGILHAGPLQLDTSSYTATLEGRPLTLSSTEFQLLHQFVKRPGKVFTRDLLLELVLGGVDEAFDRAIDVHVSRLRQKLGEDGRGASLIKTIRGVGYMLVVPS
jgi:DNA-binding response OmpR family regulator